MAVSRTLRRLLHVRDVEEEQLRMALESAFGELRSLEQARVSFVSRERAGRQLLAASAHTIETADRTAALVEVRFAARCAESLVSRIVAAESIVMHARQAYLAKRIERLQAQTLIEEAQAQDAIESGRSIQRALDDTYGAARHREQSEAGKHLRSESKEHDGPTGHRWGSPILESDRGDESVEIPESGKQFTS
jgi:hypothetical protein